MQDVIFIGRHTNLGFEPSEQGINIVETRNQLWGKENPSDKLSVDVCKEQFLSLLEECNDNNYGILFQSFPNVLVPSLPLLLKTEIKAGVVLAEVSERLSDEKQTFYFECKDDMETAQQVVEFVNSRAKYDLEDLNLTIIVDRIPKFIFAGIEWFN